MEKSVMVNLLHLFHFATRLPVVWFLEGRQEFCLPNEPSWAGKLLGRPEEADLFASLLLADARDKAVFFADTPYEEQFLGYTFGSNHLLCGPFVGETMQEKDISRLFRTLHLPLNRQEELRSHFTSLPALSQMSIHYTAYLLERMVHQVTGSEDRQPLPVVFEPQALGVDNSSYQKRVSSFRHPPLYFESEITRMISAGNQAEALRLLRELNAMTKARLADTPLRSLKNSLICAITLYTRAAIKGGVPTEEAFPLSDNCIMLTEKQQDAQALLALEEAVLKRFAQAVAQRLSKRYSELVRKAMAYVDEHLTEDLSPKTLATQLYVHPDYLSACFARETGDTLHRYVLRRRVEEAAHFMRYSQESISDIAAFYGFSSQSHFTAVFRKYKGITPQRYRMQ